MTMKREAKTEILTHHAAVLSGETRIMSYSPRQLRTYGRYLPADYAAKFETSCKRGTVHHSRESWVTERLARRLRRTRVA